MTCLRKSTTWRGDARTALRAAGIGVAAVAAALATLQGDVRLHARSGPGEAPRAAPPSPGGDVGVVTDAIAAAVQQRMGAGVEVLVENCAVRVDVADSTSVVAVLDPAMRLGRRSRVVLKALQRRGRGTRIGEATCLVRASSEHFIVRTPIRRGAPIETHHVLRTRAFLDDAPVRSLANEIFGARARRPLAPGDLLFAQDVITPPLVRTRERVVARVIADGVAVSVDGIAAQDGREGDLIRIVNPSSGRVLRARVVGPSTVEVRHGS